MTTIQIIAQAHSWLGTPFKHQGRVKGKGCDCLGLLMGLGLKTKNGDAFKKFDQINYPKLLTSNILLETLDSLFIRSKKIKPGDIILIRINNWPQHLALVVEVDPEIIIIHSYLQARKVVKQHLPEEWKKNIVAMYSADSLLTRTIT